MLEICDRIEAWEISQAEFERIRAGNHRVFNHTEKSIKCEHCKQINNFFMESALNFCIYCMEDIPRADLMLTDLEYRIKYHIGEEESTHGRNRC